MRRQDRAVTDLSEIVDIISRCSVIRLGLSDNGVPYIVPLSFGYKEKDGQITFFFHSAIEGRKIDIMKSNPHVCFELDNLLNIIQGETPCKWSAEYESVIGYGEISFIDDIEEKKSAMDLIVKKYGYAEVPEYSPGILARTALYKLSVSEIIGKRNVNV